MEDNQDDGRHYAGLMSKTVTWAMRVYPNNKKLKEMIFKRLFVVQAYEKKKNEIILETETHDEKVARLATIEQRKKDKAQRELQVSYIAIFGSCQ